MYHKHMRERNLERSRWKGGLRAILAIRLGQPPTHLLHRPTQIHTCCVYSSGVSGSYGEVGISAHRQLRPNSVFSFAYRVASVSHSASNRYSMLLADSCSRC